MALEDILIFFMGLFCVRDAALGWTAIVCVYVRQCSCQVTATAPPNSASNVAMHVNPLKQSLIFVKNKI